MPLHFFHGSEDIGAMPRLDGNAESPISLPSPSATKNEIDGEFAACAGEWREGRRGNVASGPFLIYGGRGR